MIRLCTHCKKNDTHDEEMKYCPKCLVKLRHWLNDVPEFVEEQSIRNGKELIEEQANQIYKGKVKI